MAGSSFLHLEGPVNKLSGTFKLLFRCGGTFKKPWPHYGDDLGEIIPKKANPRIRSVEEGKIIYEKRLTTLFEQLP